MSEGFHIVRVGAEGGQVAKAFQFHLINYRLIQIELYIYPV